ncbi:class I fructose-bisphosphate aldolase [Clostridium polynesiense]|uniref:class I fructose-bisphosphate aldolase n=1 Tax=Clostridium polynesiense TaxID=1325933 RepID=UPI00058E6763|nr:hypothetical protein [Clostridium polynesiense]
MSILKQQRVDSLFAKDGKAVYVPVDHGIGGIKKGLEDPVKVIEKLVEYGADGTLLQLGMAKQTMDIFNSAENPPAKIIALDYRHYWKIPGHNEGVLSCFQSSTVEQAMQYGCSAVKVMIPYGGDEKVTIDHVKILTNVIREADRLDVPVMVEPMPGGKCPPEYAKDHDVIANASRIAIELGADVLKIPYSGDKERFTELVQVSRIPVTVLGGSPKDIKTVLEAAKDITECGAKAVVFGRNVWGHHDMKGVINALKDIIHDGAEVSKTVEKYNLSGSAVTEHNYTI